MGTVGVAVTAAATGGHAAATPAPTSAVPALPTTLGGVTVGDAIVGFRVAALHEPRLGGIAIVLEAEHGRFQVDVLRRDPDGPAGVAETRALALFVANRGDGRRPTDEAQGLAVMALARALDDAEAPDGLLTFRERRERFPIGVYAAD